MDQATVIKGKWFLPSNVEKEVTGTLTYIFDKGIELEIEEPFNDQIQPFVDELGKVDIILGESSNGDLVTLYSCFKINSRWGNSYRATWYANEAYIGYHAFSESDLCFNEIVLCVNPLFLWLNNSGIKIVNLTTTPLTVNFNYTNPDNIPFCIDDNVTGELRFTVNYSFPNPYSQAIELTQTAAVSIKINGTLVLPSSDLWNYAQRFLNWLAVSTGYPNEVEKISFYHNDIVKYELPDGTKVRQEIIKYSKGLPARKKPERPDQFLFDFPKLKEYMPDALTRWFQLYESIEIVIQILAENMGRNVAFSEFHFKDIVQALEAFHRKRIRNERMPKTQYKAFKKRILDQISDEADRLFVKEQLNYGNEPRLRERLIELIDRYNSPVLESIIGDKDDFVKLVIENRNYHTHLDKSGKKTILTPIELYYLSEKALALLFVSVISEVIPDKDFVNQTLRMSNRWHSLANKSNDR